MKNYIYILLLAVLVSCKSAQLPGEERKVIFGSGGGFTGAVNTYSLSSLGTLSKLKMNGEVDTTYKIKFSKKELTEVFDIYSKIGKENLGFKKPGNMYKFIILTGEFNANPDYMWGQDGYRAPAAVEAFYDKLMALVPMVK
ncbi:MAG: hypothetical protein HYZ42_10425 [Bacteroidetes bacterium]|nr:hypothetical protein [Bacteroidota bacterium]